MKIAESWLKKYREQGIGQKTFIKSLTIFIIIFLFATGLSKGRFINPTNLMNIIVQNVLLGVVAIGQFLVILTGGIDLSVGSVIGFTSVSIVLFQGFGLLSAIIISLVISIAFGLINGTLITYLRLPAFIVTMGTMQIIYSFSQIISGGAAVYKGFDGTDINPWLLNFFKIKVAGIDVPILVYAVLIIVMILYMRTAIGCFTAGIGGNEKAAFLSGIPTKKIKVITYALSAFLSGLGGLIYILRVGEGTPQAGTLYPLDSVAAVVVGGASLAGGIGTLGGTVIGVLTISILGNLLNLLTISPMFQMAIKGMVILIAVYMNTQNKKI